MKGIELHRCGPALVTALRAGVNEITKVEASLPSVRARDIEVSVNGAFLHGVQSIDLTVVEGGGTAGSITMNRGGFIQSGSRSVRMSDAPLVGPVSLGVRFADADTGETLSGFEVDVEFGLPVDGVITVSPAKAAAVAQ